jgi:hypothetical protein
MKITLVFGFSGGQLAAECTTFDEADEVLQYALKRGAINVAVPQADGTVATADLTASENVEPAPEFTPEVTVEDAQQAVKDYAAKHGIEKGRDLLAKFKLKRTNEIKAEQAAAIVEACNE